MTRCYRCGHLSPYGFGIVFGELKGAPLVCSQCVFEKLTGELKDWSTDVVRVPDPTGHSAPKAGSR